MVAGYSKSHVCLVQKSDKQENKNLEFFSSRKFPVYIL